MNIRELCEVSDGQPLPGIVAQESLDVDGIVRLLVTLDSSTGTSRILTTGSQAWISNQRICLNVDDVGV